MWQISGYFKRTITSYLGTGTVLFLWLIVWPIVGMLLGSLQPQNDADAQAEFLKFIFYVFWAHHPVAPLVITFRHDLFPGGTMPFNPTTALIYALGVWLVMGVFFFFLACRGLRGSLTEKG